MSNHKIIRNNLSELLLLTKEVLSENQYEFIHSYIVAGEWALALETLCDVLIEDELPIPERAYNFLKETGEVMLMPKETWEPLQAMVEDKEK